MKKTSDSFFDGRLQIDQFENGYRFSIDAVLLSNFVEAKSGDRILDLGTGCGVISLILAHHYPNINIYGVEIQKDLAHLAIQNVNKNSFENRIKIFNEDFKILKSNSFETPFNIVVCNPPYYRAKSGRINPNNQKAIARHEIHADIDEIIITARRMLQNFGQFNVIYPCERLIDLISKMRKYNIEPKKITFVHSNENSIAKLVLVQGIKSGKANCQIEPPVFIYDLEGNKIYK